jgi:hypothetical protein
MPDPWEEDETVATKSEKDPWESDEPVKKKEISGSGYELPGMPFSKSGIGNAEAVAKQKIQGLSDTEVLAQKKAQYKPTGSIREDAKQPVVAKQEEFEGPKLEREKSFWDHVGQVASDVAGGINRAILKTPSALVKTEAEIANKIGSSITGKDSKVEDDYLYSLADKYDKWIDEQKYIGDKNVNSLAGDVGGGLGQIATMVAGGGLKTGTSIVKAATSAPFKEVAKNFLSKPFMLAFGQVFDSEYQQMKDKGESDDVAFKQALENGLATAPLENLPLANLASRFTKSMGAPLAKRALNGVIQGAEEGGQEMVQQAVSNLTNNQLAELESSTVEWSKGLEQSGKAGSVVGLILGSIAGAKNGRIKKQENEGQSIMPIPEYGEQHPIDATGAEQNTPLPPPQESIDQPVGGQIDQTAAINEPQPNQEVQAGVFDQSGTKDIPAENGATERQVTTESTFESISKGEMTVDDAAKLLNTNPDELKSQIFEPVGKAGQAATSTDVGVDAVLGGPDGVGTKGGAAPIEESQGGEQTGRTVKKTILAKRAYEGDFREDVKKQLELHGLTRQTVSLKEARSDAKEFLDNVGEEAAFEAIMNGDVKGASQAMLFQELIDRQEEKMIDSKDPDELADLYKKQAQLVSFASDRATEAGQYNAAWGDIYKQSSMYNLNIQKERFKNMNGGFIPPSVEEKFEQYDAKIKELDAKIAEYEKKSLDEAAHQSIDAIKKDTEKKKRSKRKEGTGKDRIAKGFSDLASAIGATQNAIGDKRARVSRALADIGLGLIEEGKATIEDVFEKTILAVQKKFGTKADYADYSDDFHSHLNERMSQEETTETPVKINKKLLRELVESGITDVNDLVKAIRERMPEKYSKASDREIMDAITGYGKTINMSKDEIDSQVNKLKSIARSLSKLDDISKGKHPVKTGLQRGQTDSEIRKYEKQVREAMKTLPLDEDTKENMIRTVQDMKKRALKNRIEDLKLEIVKKEKTKRNNTEATEDGETKDLKAILEQTQKEHDEVFKEENTKEHAEKRLSASKKALKNRISELEKRISDKDFSPRKRNPIIADTELTKLRSEKEAVKEKYDIEFEKHKFANRTKAQKAIDMAKDVWGLSRLLQASIDFGVIGIQGGIYTNKYLMTNPKVVGKAISDAFKNGLNKKRSEKWFNDIKSQEWYDDAKKSKLSITSPNAKATAREEVSYSNLADLAWKYMNPRRLVTRNKSFDTKWENANPLHAFERWSTTYMDSLRAARFQEAREKLFSDGLTFDSHPKAFKDVAGTINTFTGRSSLDGLENMSEGLSTVFYSPRNWMSIIKQTTPYGLVRFAMMSDGKINGERLSRAQKLALTDFSTAVGTTAAMVAMTAAYLNNDDDEDTGVNLDKPFRSDFLKVKYRRENGDVVTQDPWGGKLPMIVLQARLYLDSYESGNTDGTVQLGSGYGVPTRLETIGRMATNKLAPSASLFDKYLSTHVDEEGNRNSFGKEWEWSEEAKKTFAPMIIENKKLLQDDPKSLDGIAAFLSLIGYGTQVQEAK